MISLVMVIWAICLISTLKLPMIISLLVPRQNVKSNTVHHYPHEFYKQIDKVTQNTIVPDDSIHF